MEQYLHNAQFLEIAGGTLGALVILILFFLYRRSRANVQLGPNEALRRARFQQSAALDKAETGDLSAAAPPRPELKIVRPPLESEERPKTIDEILSKTRAGFWGRVQGLISTSALDQTFIDSLEEILYSNDLGPRTVEQLLERVRDQLGHHDSNTPAAVKAAIRGEVERILSRSSEKTQARATADGHKPHVILVVGVNGVGKTTTIGKMAHRFSSQNKRVLVAAGDTFRAAAAEQLGVWTQRAGVDIFNSELTKDPAAVAYEALQNAKSNGFDVVIVDTAGRLHTQANLMEELKKVKRVMEKAMAGTPHETLLVVDANTGQNALNQARQFNEALGLTGLVVTKLDGTAKGGVIVGIANELGVGVRHIGVGEKLADLRDFSAQEYVQGLFGT